MPRNLLLLLGFALLFCPLTARAAEEANSTTGKPPEPPAANDATGEPAARLQSIEKLARDAKRSIVIVTVGGRDGGRGGLGTGFVVSSDGLIATNLHVIGEARPISVQFADGKKYDVTAVHASDRAMDLALIRINAKDLPELPLGDSDRLEQGASIVALGNPQGLKHSVVSGVISGAREVEGRRMIQLAIPIEPGNSGGPVLDRAGRVIGVVTMKSAVTENLGFAMPVNAIKALIEKPNPVPLGRWLTIGALDPAEWEMLLGSGWQQRSGRIHVSRPGKGFGGRSLCLAKTEVPELPYELATWVKLDDEAGAAGLVFHSDGRNRHYGFYPSAGKLRLTRFEGATVYSWKVLFDEPNEHYQPGQWNHLKVRLEKDKINCYVNDQLVLSMPEAKLDAGRFGLAKFRDTAAEFKGFQVAEKIGPSRLDPKLVERLTASIEKLPPLENLLPEQIAPLASDARNSAEVFRRRARELERKAEEYRRLAGDVHVQAASRELAAAVKGDDAKIDLSRAALLVAWLDNSELDVPHYLKQIDQMTAEIKRPLPNDADPATRLKALDEYLFTQNGFHGSRTDYYHRANSHLDRVIDDREGLPITLSVLYMELGRRLDLQLVGVGLPGHFVVRHEPAEGPSELIDVFEGGQRMTRDAAAMKVMALTGGPLDEEHLKSTTKREIIARMLSNLLGIAQRAGDKEGMLRYLEALVAVDAESLQHRGMRAVIRVETGRRDAGIADLDWFIDNQPPGADVERIRRMREYFLHRR